MTARKQKLNTEVGAPPQGDPGLNIIVAQLEVIANQQRLIAQNLASLQTTTDVKFAEFQRETVKQKVAAEEGLRAAMEQMYKHIETKIIDPAALELQLKAAHEEAERNANDKRTRFSEMLRDATTGNVISYEAGTVVLTVNGNRFAITSGFNAGVPAPFIELWNDRIEQQKDATRRDLAIQGSHDFGVLEAWRADGRATGLE